MKKSFDDFWLGSLIQILIATGFIPLALSIVPLCILAMIRGEEDSWIGYLTLGGLIFSIIMMGIYKFSEWIYNIGAKENK